MEALSSQVTLHPRTVRSEVGIGESTLARWLVCCQNLSMTGNYGASRPIDRMIQVIRKAES